MSEAEVCRLYRVEREAIVCGVCRGIAAYLGVDPSIVRLATLLLMLISPLLILVYLAACIVVPKEPYPGAAKKCINNLEKVKGPTLIVIGILLIVIGAALLSNVTAFWKSLTILSAVGFIALGLLLILYGFK